MYLNKIMVPLLNVKENKFRIGIFHSLHDSSNTFILMTCHPVLSHFMPSG